MSAIRFRWTLLQAGLVALVLSACGGGDDSGPPAGGAMGTYTATSLVSDVNTSANPYATSNVDPNLVNSWGIAFNPAGGPFCLIDRLACRTPGKRWKSPVP